MSEPRSIGRYVVREEIARGASGRVLRVHDPRLGREVAIKVLHGPHALSEQHQRRFQREGRALSRLRHPGIVALHEIGSDRGSPFLVMDLIEGESLGRRIKREGPLPIDEAVALSLTVARALDHAHAHGILHRDVKPDNVVSSKAGGRPRGGAGRLRAGAEPGSPEAHLLQNRGLALEKTGRTEQALESYRRALEIDPAHLGAAAKLGFALSSLERWPEAEAALQRALGIARRTGVSSPRVEEALREAQAQTQQD